MRTSHSRPWCSDSEKRLRTRYLNADADRASALRAVRTGNTRMRNHSSLVKESIADQAEFFLRKFNRHDDVDRAAVMTLKAEFEKFDTFGKRELDDTQAMRMLEARGQPHSL